MESSIFSGIGIDPGIIVIVLAILTLCIRHLYFAV